jgi:hypothetical protein
MTSFQLEDPVKEAFQSATASKTAPDVRTLLVQTSASGKSLSLNDTLSASQSDKEDFAPQLTKVFGEEPNRSGYALYRLDSQAANGDWEWLCIAYQPEGAKVKEKMQYVKTRTALLNVLNEQHFIETIYATSASDLRFPTRLRNARKHDYQNPQLKTAGKPASEAAGTDAGGAKRNFGQFTGKPAGTNSAARAHESSSQSSELAAVSSAPATVNAQAADPPAKIAESKSAVAHFAPADPPAVVAKDQEQRSVSASSCLEENSDQTAVGRVSAAATRKGAPLEHIASAASPSKATTKEVGEASTDVHQEEEEAGSIAPSAQAHLPAMDVSSGVLTQARNEGDGEVRSVLQDTEDQGAASVNKADELAADVDEQALAESKAPEEPPSRSALETDSPQELSQPQVPSPELAKQQLLDDNVPVSKAKSQTEVDELACQPEVSALTSCSGALTSKSLSSAKSHVKSQGYQTGQSGQSSIGGGGGRESEAPSSFTSPKSYKWTGEAESALSGLAERASGSSEHNFVSLSLIASTCAAHQIEVASPPRFLTPGDLQAALRSMVSECTGITFAFYRYPCQAEDKRVVFMYTEAPRGDSAAQKSIYANSLEPIRRKAAELTSLDVERDGVNALYGPYPRPMPDQAEDVSSRIESVKYRVEEASKAAGRSKAPRLVAVSKLHPPSSILAAYVHAKQTHFGENYVQEMKDKAKVLPPDIRWHFVGGLQSNKGKLLASIPNLYLLETLDSIKAADVLEKALASPDAVHRDEPLRVYLQVNTSGEEVKSGLPPLTKDAGGTEDGKDEPLLELAKHVITKCPNLILSGLMTIGSAANSSADAAATSRDEALCANPDFAKLFESRRLLVQRLRCADLDNSSYADLLTGEGAEDGGLELSMGMTADFPIAIAAGSDNVRIGTDCFGVRPGTREEAKKAMEGEINMDVGAANPLLGEKGFAKPKRPGGRK